jgi:hypothetical protein
MQKDCPGGILDLDIDLDLDLDLLDLVDQ